MLRALRIYPQILSLYVGFDNGEFFMVRKLPARTPQLCVTRLMRRRTRPSPTKSSPLHRTARVRGAGYFCRGRQYSRATRFGAGGVRSPSAPLVRYGQNSDVVERSDLYIFATSGEPGFTLSRRFGGQTPGVMGADLAAIDW